MTAYHKDGFVMLRVMMMNEKGGMFVGYVTLNGGVKKQLIGLCAVGLCAVGPVV